MFDFAENKLKELRLGGNKITELEPKNFHRLTSLNSLRLSDNKIRKIRNKVFQGLV